MHARATNVRNDVSFMLCPKMHLHGTSIIHSNAAATPLFVECSVQLVFTRSFCLPHLQLPPRGQ